MRLYSVQPLCIWEQLHNGDVVIANTQFKEDDPLDTSWKTSYEWLASQMELMGITRPVGVQYPFWAWFQWNGINQPKPDLRSTMMKRWSKNESKVLLTLDIPETSVCLSDYDAWHFCLNYWYLDNEKNATRFEKHCKATLGVTHYTAKPLPDAALHQQLVNTWDVIFDLPKAARALEVPLSEQIIQATFWELRPEYVQEVVQFGVGRAKKLKY